MRPTWAMTVTMQLWLWRLKNSVYCWQSSIMVISVRGWYWFPRGLLLNPGFVCLSWCFDPLRLAFTVDFHSNSCVNNHRILTVSIKGNLEMFCLGEFCSTVFPILLFPFPSPSFKRATSLGQKCFECLWSKCIGSFASFYLFKISWFWRRVTILFHFSLVI